MPPARNSMPRLLGIWFTVSVKNTEAMPAPAKPPMTDKAAIRKTRFIPGPPVPSMLLSGRIKAFADEPGQLRDRVGLGQEVAAFQQRGILARHARTVAAGVNHFEARTLPRQAFGQLASHNAAGHHH